MFPHFQRVLTLTVMILLVSLFTWIYSRERHQRVRLWMIGWICILVHFTGMTLESYSLIPTTLASWLAYSTLLLAVSLGVVAAGTTWPAEEGAPAVPSTARCG